MSIGFLLDTNVPSELIRQLPEPRVRQWQLSQRPESLFLSVLTVGELRKGTHLLAPGKERKRLEDWFTTELLPSFAGRILPVTQPIADRWGNMTAMRRKAGRPFEPIDALIAATAFEHNLTLVTRNVSHMAGVGVKIINPWELTL